MSNQGQGLLNHVYLAFVCCVHIQVPDIGECLQDHWSSGYYIQPSQQIGTCHFLQAISIFWLCMSLDNEHESMLNGNQIKCFNSVKILVL